MEFQGKRVLVIGLGASGVSAARALHARRAALALCDRRADADRANLPPGDLHLGPEDPNWLNGVDLVVVSPGVPRDSVLVRAAVQRTISVISEIELASQFIEAPIVAVTGTNGKSTVTVMLGGILRAAGLRTFVGGNLGTPLCEATNGAFDAIVAEISSFQLEWIDEFRPRVGIYLNLSDDHFDRYRDLNEYGQAKARLFENQRPRDWAILNRDDPNVWRIADSLRSRVLGFGVNEKSSGVCIWQAGRAFEYRIGKRDGLIELEGIRLFGPHNLANAMAAAAGALALGTSEEAITRGLMEFKPLAHRVEVVREKAGVKWIDDSKGTNVGAVVQALASVSPPVILIAGGVDKGGDYSALIEPLRRKARRIILIGAAREKMRAALDEAGEIELATTLGEAVERAARIAQHGDTVLLSPACSSFDQFKDYAERGNVFKELVRAL